MAEPLKEGLTVTFQGKVCSPTFSITRNVGLEPDFGYVFVPVEEFQVFEIGEGVEGLDSPGRPGDREKGRGFSSVGDLVVTEAVLEGGASRVHSVTFKDLLLSERAVETAIADDEEALVMVEVTDFRYLYDKRGVIFQWVNVPVQTSSGVPSRAEIDASLLNRVLPEYLPFVKGSMRNGASPWTLRQVLEEVVLPNLPGRPKLKRLPAPLEGAFPLGHVWDGASGKQALQDLLDEFQAIFSLNLDGTVSLWGQDEGDLQEVSGKQILYDTSKPTCDPRVSQAKRLVSFNYVPTCVLVLGPPAIQAEVFELEPVGVYAGSVVPLDEALFGIGIGIGTARRLALLPHEKRVLVPGMTERGLREFERWAFRWYRIPGSERDNAHMLPLVGRAETGEAGEILDEVVSSETFLKVSAFAVELANVRAQAGALGSPLRQAIEKKIKAAEERDALIQCVNVPAGTVASAGSYTIDRERGIVMFSSIQGHVSVEGVPPEEAILADRDAKVVLVAAYAEKPPFDGQVDDRDHYCSVWVRDGGGKVTQVDQVPDGVMPAVIARPDLQEFRGLNGTNVDRLDAAARVAASAILTRPQAIKGAVVTLARPAPIANTGRTRSITWATNAEIPSVVAHVGTFGPFAPSPEAAIPRTIAVGTTGGHISISRALSASKIGRSL